MFTGAKTLHFVAEYSARNTYGVCGHKPALTLCLVYLCFFEFLRCFLRRDMFIINKLLFRRCIC